MDENKLTTEEELVIFKNINSFNKKYKSEHLNFINTNKEYDVLRNQGIARAKLREFITKEDVNYEYWKSI